MTAIRYLWIKCHPDGDFHNGCNTPPPQGDAREQVEESPSGVGQLQQKHLEKVQHLEAQLAAKDQEALVRGSEGTPCRRCWTVPRLCSCSSRLSWAACCQGDLPFYLICLAVSDHVVLSCTIELRCTSSFILFDGFTKHSQAVSCASLNAGDGTDSCLLKNKL